MDRSHCRDSLQRRPASPQKRQKRRKTPPDGAGRSMASTEAGLSAATRAFLRTSQSSAATPCRSALARKIRGFHSEKGPERKPRTQGKFSPGNPETSRNTARKCPQHRIRAAAGCNHVRNSQAQIRRIMARTPRKPTPEELRWRRSAHDPEKAKRNLRRQYGLLGLWSALTLGWIISVATKYLSFSWVNVIILIFGYLNLALGILRNRRITASKKQF